MKFILLQIINIAQSTSIDPIGNLEFILGLVQALAWPIVALVIALIFKNQIRDLVKAIRRIRLGQLEAKIERVKDEAAATISQLRDLALALSAPAAGSLPGFISNRRHYISFDAPPVYKRLEQAKKIVEALTKLGVERSEAESMILTPIIQHIRNAHVKWIRDIANEKLSPKVSNSLMEEEQDLPVIDKLKAKELSISEVKESLEKRMDKLPKELEERLKDLKHFDETGELRRPSVKPWNDSEDK